ncbi:hypothetical protein [Ureibacillus acetophenoni]|uniref:Acetyltransferase (GNAT) family protein n=1 Tax=Ureibacillus acetophenoni TaxID=614649 RepID=A0A285UTX9_9BACL|nr:hypothetical protein [Ureibacillus acetophenoni]SOC43691.1 hypothetical protein SAMN05877842_11715 [Ureibacillus acetophenoni]
MNITIRKMHYQDTKQVQNIAKTTWNATYEGIIPLEVQNKFLSLNYNDESMKQRIERSIVYVDGKFVVIGDSFDPSNLCQPIVFNKLTYDFLQKAR